MRIAIVDCGTNTFNLFIAEVVGANFRRLFKTKIAVKLGQGGIDKGFISPTAFQRGIEALKAHAATITKYEVDKVAAYATSAVRGASNGAEFVKQAHQQTGIDIEIIEGQTEAELIYYGARQALDLGNENVLIMDIGGGSTEFIIANNENISWARSYKVGVSRLLELFTPTDPIGLQQVQDIEVYLEQELGTLFEALARYPVKVLIGSSGSFDSFAAMIAHRHKMPKMLKGKTTYEFSFQEVLQIHNELLLSTYSERLGIKGLVEMRADMIVLASICIQFIIKKFTFEKMKLSTYALKEGALWKLINHKTIV